LLVSYRLLLLSNDIHTIVMGLLFGSRGTNSHCLFRCIG